ncbi:MAG: hypothetical protein RIC29_17435 [Rhodospirillaceae bacterium]
MHASHCRKTTTDGWNLDQGLAAQYAAQAGLDPDLAADAGEEVWDVLKSLRDATSATAPRRQAKLVRRTKTRLAKVLLSKAGLSRHGELVQHIEAKLLTLQGRGGDTELAHLTPGEMVVPSQLQTPEVVQALQQAAQNAGIDLRRYTAGSPASSVNPETGLEEYSVECADEGGCRQDPVGYRGPNIYDYGGTTYVNVTGTSTSPTGQYDAYSADNWTGGRGGSGSGGFGSGGVPYGPEPEDEKPEYGTKENPVPDPPWVDYTVTGNTNGTTSFRPGPPVTVYPGVNYPGSGLGAGIGGGYDPSIGPVIGGYGHNDSTKPDLGLRDHFLAIIAPETPSVTEYSTWSEGELRQELNEAQSGSRSEVNNMENTTKGGHPRASIGFGIQAIYYQAKLARIREACRINGYAC